MSDSIASALRRHYRPSPTIRVGVLEIAGALEQHLDEVDALLVSAGHTSARRFARLQTRAGEATLRRDDVFEFLDLYGHEYALVAIRGWSGPGADDGSAGAEADLVALAIARGAEVVWSPAPGDDVDAAVAAGAEVLGSSA